MVGDFVKIAKQFPEVMSALSKTNFLKTTFSWNNLPTPIKNLNSINIFKAKLKDN